MAYKIRLFSSTLILSGVIGCIPEFDDDVSRIESSRILAMRSEPAEPAPGDVVQLTALVASLEDDSVENLTWKFCALRKPATETGPVAQDCVREFSNPESTALRNIGEGAPIEASIDSDVCRSFGPLSPPQVQGQADSGRPADPDQTGGYFQPVFASQAESNETTTAPVFGAIRLLCGGAGIPQSELIKFNQGYRPNVNPNIAQIFMGVGDNEDEVLLDTADGATAVPPDTQLHFRVSWEACPEESTCGDGLCTVNENSTNCADDCRSDAQGCSGAEQYLWADPAQGKVVQAVESVAVAWFATDGTFADSETDNVESATESSNVYTTPTAAGDVRLWLVVRDSRGGTNWSQLQLSVRDDAE